MASPNRMERGEGADPLSHYDPWGNFRAGSCGGTETHAPSTPDGSAHSAGSKGKGFSQPIFATTYHDVTNAQVPSPAGVGFGPGKGKGNVGTTFPTAVYAPQQPTLSGICTRGFRECVSARCHVSGFRARGHYVGPEGFWSRYVWWYGVWKRFLWDVARSMFWMCWGR